MCLGRSRDVELALSGIGGGAGLLVRNGACTINGDGGLRLLRRLVRNGIDGDGGTLLRRHYD